MNFKDILKIAAVGAVVYGAYKLGEKRGQKKYIDIEPIEEEKDFYSVVDEKLNEGKSALDKEINYIKDIIKGLQEKSNKTKSDKNTLDLLKIKLEQLMKGK